MKRPLYLAAWLTLCLLGAHYLGSPSSAPKHLIVAQFLPFSGPVWLQPPCLSFYPVDTFVNMNGQSVGTAVSIANLKAATDGSSNTWSKAGAVYETFGASQVGTLPATVTVNGGPTHTCGFATQSLALNESGNQNNSAWSILTPASGHNIIVVSGWVANLPPNQGGNGSLWDLVKLDTGAGAEAIIQLVSGTDQPQSNCKAYGIEIEKTSGGTGHSPCITVSPGGTYFYSFKVDFSSNSLASLNLYTTNGAVFTQVGSTVTTTLGTTGNITIIFYGNVEFGTAPGNTMYFQNMMIDYTNLAYPNLPH